MLLPGRAEVLAATGNHPYARLTTASGPVRAFAGAGATAWLTALARGMVASAWGAPEAAVRLVTALADRGELAGVRRVNLPRLDPDAFAAQLPIGQVDEWDALTAGIARALFADCDVVTLGVMTDNHRADRLYRRLGFVDSTPRSSANLRPQP